MPIAFLRQPATERSLSSNTCPQTKINSTFKGGENTPHSSKTIPLSQILSWGFHPVIVEAPLIVDVGSTCHCGAVEQQTLRFPFPLSHVEAWLLG
jgi:hypothetical protein